jgi:hypothetical protein
MNQGKEGVAGRWTFYSWLIIGFLAFLLVFRWPLLPNFLDIYYHLASAEGFAKAGGFVTHDFWSYAPAGRPHLYPPLFHFVILTLLKTGLSPLFVARLLDATVFPVLLAVIWFFMRSLFNVRLAFFSVLISASLYSFYLSSSNFMPATFACIFGLLSLWAQEKGKIVSAAIFLSLAFYSHVQIPWFFVLTFIAYGFLNRPRLTACLTVILCGIALSSPLIAYLFRNRHFYNPSLMYENFILEFNLYLLLAFFGIGRAVRERGRFFLLLALAIAITPFIFSYSYRYISGQGMLGFIFLSACGLDAFFQRKEAKRFLIPCMLLFILFSPSIAVGRSKAVAFSVYNSTYANLVSFEKKIQRPNEFSLSSSKFMTELIQIVKNNSREDDIITCNLPFMATIFSALIGRADADAMLQEIDPGTWQDPMRQARLIIWFKDKEGKRESKLRALVSAYRLEKVAETGIAYVYRNNVTRSRERVQRADIPNSGILVIALFVAAILMWDILRK